MPVPSLLSNDCANAGDATLIAASTAMRASFDVLIMEILLVTQPNRRDAGTAAGQEMGPVQAILNWQTAEQTINETRIIPRPLGNRSGLCPVHGDLGFGRAATCCDSPACGPSTQIGPKMPHTIGTPHWPKR